MELQNFYLLIISFYTHTSFPYTTMVNMLHINKCCAFLFCFFSLKDLRQRRSKAHQAQRVNTDYPVSPTNGNLMPEAATIKGAPTATCEH